MPPLPLTLVGAAENAKAEANTAVTTGISEGDKIGGMEEYREQMNAFGSLFASIARQCGGIDAALRNNGLHNHCPVCIKYDIAVILKLPLNSYWTPDEIGEIISCQGRQFSLFIWDSYISDGESTHVDWLYVVHQTNHVR